MNILKDLKATAKALDAAATAFFNTLWPVPPPLWDEEWLAEKEAAEEVAEPNAFVIPAGVALPAQPFDWHPSITGGAVLVIPADPEAPVVDVAGAGVPTTGSPPEAVSPTVSGGHSNPNAEELARFLYGQIRDINSWPPVDECIADDFRSRARELIDAGWINAPADGPMFWPGDLFGAAQTLLCLADGRRCKAKDHDEHLRVLAARLSDIATAMK